MQVFTFELKVFTLNMVRMAILYYYSRYIYLVAISLPYEGIAFDITHGRLENFDVLPFEY